MDESTYDELKWTARPLYSTSPLSNEDNTEEKLETHLNQTSSDPTNTTQDETNKDPSSRPRIPIHAESTALLIVDVQPEYWTNCPPVQKDFPDFPKSLANLIATCRKRKTKIIWVRADYCYTHSPWLIQFNRLQGKNIPPEVHCDPATSPITWEEFATPDGGEVIITKRSWSSTSNTALMECLKSWGIQTVLVCGLITSVCVQHSAFGIFEAGYRTLLVTDCCADRGRARHDAALALYGDYMYELVTSEELGREGDGSGGIVPAKPMWFVIDDTTRMVKAFSYTNLKAVGMVTKAMPGRKGYDEKKEEISQMVNFTSE